MAQRYTNEPLPDLRVFISSTFQDMAEERDRLVRRVFPALRRRCLAYQISICEIDLRWGVTEDAARKGDVLRLCLAEIDRCYPFFIAMLGERYGWIDPEAASHIDRVAPHLLPYADRSVTELEIRYAILNRTASEAPICFFYFRAEGSQPAPVQSDLAHAKMVALREEIRAAGHLVRPAYPDADAFAAQVMEDLWTAITARVEAARGQKPGWTSLLSPRTSGFVERRAVLQRVEDALAGRRRVVLRGEPGAGKTTFISHWIRERSAGSSVETVEAAHLHFRPTWRRRLKAWITRQDMVVQAAAVIFFSTAIDGAVNGADQSWPRVAVSILMQVRALAGIDEPVPFAVSMIPGTLGRWLAMAARTQPIVLILDGLEDALGPNAPLDWLPLELPPEVVLVLSANSDRFAARFREQGWRNVVIPPLSHRERRSLMQQYLASYGKQLSATQQRAVLSLRPVANPLYLRTLLDQMRETGRFETLSEQLAAFQDIDSLTPLLERAFALIEQEMARDWPPGGLTPRALALLAASRAGLSEAELRELLGDMAGRLPDRVWSPLHLFLEPYLVRAGGTLRFSNVQVRTAAERRLPDLKATLSATRRILVNYHFREPTVSRSLEELPWLLAALEDWDTLAVLIGKPAILIALIAERPFDAASLWTALTAQSSYRHEQVFATIFAAPLDDAAATLALARLLGDVGETGAALRLLEAIGGNPASAAANAAIQSQLSLLLELRNFAQAAPLAERQVALCHTAGLRSALAAAQDNLALIRIEQDRAAEALSLQAEAEAHHRDQGQDRALAISLGIGASALFRLGRVEEAVQKWRTQETQARLVGDLRCLAASLGNQAAVLNASGEAVAAEHLVIDQERLCRQINDRYGLQNALANRAAVLAALDRYDEALDALSERAVVAKTLGDPVGEIAALLQRADIFLRLRDPRSAATLFERAKAQMDDPAAYPADIQAQTRRIRRIVRDHGMNAGTNDQPDGN